MTHTPNFQELLRIVYRFIFMFTAEDRGLLRPKDQAETPEAKLYAEGYSVARLRTKTVRSLARDRHHDLWDGVRIVFRGLAHGEKRLALPVPHGEQRVGILVRPRAATLILFQN